MPECQKIKNGGLDQYGAERYGRVIFATIRTNVGMKGLMRVRAKLNVQVSADTCQSLRQMMKATTLCMLFSAVSRVLTTKLRKIGIVGFDLTFDLKRSEICR